MLILKIKVKRKAKIDNALFKELRAALTEKEVSSSSGQNTSADILASCALKSMTSISGRCKGRGMVEEEEE